ncbi:YbaB/EbfC family nucleoid-associated protein [Actinophytocola oryzae]|uniref:YbaB/EbfC family nucleoid-associated protein n=1 Tax=Actinophytocola oryzae TaxID=502181 RepID=UPI001FBB7C9A|nr:YbaB/EbfC family nucleoid-associated protein [Actinophytocola oryzae]
MAEHRAQVEDLIAGYRRSREQLGAVQRRLAAVRETMTSDDGLVAVTVSSSGALLGLEIAEAAYRALRPAELAALIVRTTADATAKVTRVAGEVLAPVLPSDTDPDALLRGTADLSAAELAPPPAVEPEETFEDRTWMQSGSTRDAR